MATQIEILLVEDNEGDANLTAIAFQKAKILNRLHAVDDGEKAMKFLMRQDEFSTVPRPDLILLDLNLPKKDGREILDEIKRDPELRRIPVVVMTTSQADEDIARSYDLHANSYIQKPVDFAGFMEVIRSIDDYWLAVVKLPPRRDS